MNMQYKFQNLISNETGFFSDTCEMMLHSQVKNGRQFLCAMNNVVDYCCSQTNKKPEDINYHIIYVPTCPEWARELLAKFLLHKVAFTYSDEFIPIAKQETSSTIYLPEKTTKKFMTQLHERRAYFKKFINLFEGKPLPKNDKSKSLFVLQEKDVTTRKQDKNTWIEQLYTENIFNTKKNTVVTTSDTAFNIEEQIRKNRGLIPIIENVFIFHSKNRGRITFSYNKQQIERLNRYGVGIKNCLIFYISERPFRLYHAQDNIKYTLSSNLLSREIKKYDDFDGFIIFTPQEINRMFHRMNRGTLYLIDHPDRAIFTSEIDSYFDELEHNYKIKNALSLAFDEETQRAFLKECEKETGVSQQIIVQPFLNYYKQIWNSEIRDNILLRISGCKTVAFILPKWVKYEYKLALKQSFQTEKRKVFITDFDSLKNGVTADIIILFAYRYTDVKYKTFPNSFDPLPLKPGQMGLTVINKLTHNRYYEWNKYFYDKSYNGLLYSDFRQDKIGWSKKNFQRPVIPDIFDNIDEAEADAREYMAERCVIQFENGKIKPLAASRVLYYNGKNYCISCLKELPFEAGMKIQMLDDIVDQIKDSLLKKTSGNLKSEEYIRSDKLYALTENEINSDIELWKYLLKRKVCQNGVENAYKAVFPTDKEISIRGFERWLDFDYPMILPRSRKSQNNLLIYLGFNIGGPYHRIILTKKLMRNNNTRLLNSQIESLLQSILTVTKIRNGDFNELFECHSEILTLLEINNASEVNTLVELLNIQLKKVINIIYDSN